MPDILRGIIIALIGYLWGSIPAGYWMGKLLRGRDFDIRDYGSHKTGATNVLRTLGKGPAAIVFLFDISKGVGPTLLATLVPLFYLGGWGPTIAALMALIGHCFPVFIGFKGGRGVSTGAGAVLVISPLTFVIAGIATFSTIAISRYVSLGSILGVTAGSLLMVLLVFLQRLSPWLAVYAVAVGGLVVVLHHDNIERLLKGTERKFSLKPGPPRPH